MSCGKDVPDLVPVGPTGTRFSAFLLHPSPPGAPALRFAPYRDDPINRLWLIPITAAERALSEAEGSRELLPRLAAAGVDWVHRDRRPVVEG